MVDTPELFGLLSPATGHLKSWLTNDLVSALASSDVRSESVQYRTDPNADYRAVPLPALRSRLGDESYLEIKDCRLTGDSPVNCALHIVERHPMWAERAPLVHAYFHQEQLFNPDARERTETLVSFVETLGEELPVELLRLTSTGPSRPAELPTRGEYASQVMRGDVFLSLLSPEIVDEINRETLTSLPAYEIRHLSDGSVLIRSVELLSEVSGSKTLEIRRHLDLE